MNSKISSIVVIVIGAAVLLASVFAESIGLGDEPGFGSKQITGTIIGIVVLAAGAYLYRKGDAGSSGGNTDNASD